MHRLRPQRGRQLLLRTRAACAAALAGGCTSALRRRTANSLGSSSRTSSRSRASRSSGSGMSTCKDADYQKLEKGILNKMKMRGNTTKRINRIKTARVCRPCGSGVLTCTGSPFDVQICSFQICGLIARICSSICGCSSCIATRGGRSAGSASAHGCGKPKQVNAAAATGRLD